MNTQRCILNGESGVTKAEMFPNFKTNSKHCSKTTHNAHAQVFFHHSCLCNLEWGQKPWFVTNCHTPLPTSSSSCLLSPRLQMVRLIQQKCVECHGGWMCSDGLLLRTRHICDLSTHRYWQYPPGQDFCNISSCKTRMNLNLGVFDLAGPQKALQKCFLSFDGMLETKLGDAEVYFNLDEAICQNLFVWQNLYWC